ARRGRLQIETLEDRCVPTNAPYVASLYQSLLHRTPSCSEEAGWVRLLDSGVSPEQVALGFVNSREYKGDLVAAEYQSLLGRAGSAGEVTAWVSKLLDGLPEEQLTVGFLNSSEYLTRNGNNNTAWLYAVYRDVLGRAPDPGGLGGWSEALVT